MINALETRCICDWLADLQVPLEKEDMYMPQAEAFVSAVRSRDSSGIRSTYEDAVESYKVSQWITAASSAERA